MRPENEEIDAWQQQEVPEEVLEPELEIVDPVSAHAVKLAPHRSTAGFGRVCSLLNRQC
jgi:hypothetical protein